MSLTVMSQFILVNGKFFLAHRADVDDCQDSAEGFDRADHGVLTKKDEV